MQQEYNEETPAAKAKEALKPLAEAVHKIGIAKIILAIVIVIAALWFFSLPKPGSLTITVKELDFDNSVDSAIVSLQWPDGQSLGGQFTSITDSEGRAVFQAVPTAQKLAIVVQPQSVNAFETNIAETTIQSGGSEELTIYLAKKANVTITPSTIRGTVSERCVKEAVVEIRNNDAGELPVNLVGEEALAGAVSSTTMNLLGGEAQNITLFLDAAKARAIKGRQIANAIRIKGTNKKISISLDVSDAPKIEVAPEALRCAPGAGREVCLFIVSVKNNGDYTLNNLKVEPSDTVRNVLDGGDVERYYTIDAVPPKGEAKFGVKLLSATPAIGVITVKGDCFLKQVEVQTG